MLQPRVRAPMGHLITDQPLSVLAIDFTPLERSSDGKENVLVMTGRFYQVFVSSAHARSKSIHGS